MLSVSADDTSLRPGDTLVSQRSTWTPKWFYRTNDFFHGLSAVLMTSDLPLHRTDGLLSSKPLSFKKNPVSCCVGCAPSVDGRCGWRRRCCWAPTTSTSTPTAARRAGSLHCIHTSLNQNKMVKIRLENIELCRRLGVPNINPGRAEQLAPEPILEWASTAVVDPSDTSYGGRGRVGVRQPAAICPADMVPLPMPG